MTIERISLFAPTYLLAMFRVAGVVMVAPVFGSSMIPRQMKLVIAMAITVGLMPGIRVVEQLPKSWWEIAGALACEAAIGVVFGLALNLVFMAAQWAGEMAAAQMGLSLGGIFDPLSGGTSSALGSLYLTFATVIFLLLNGHHAIIRGLGASFTSLPLLSVKFDAQLMQVFVALLQSATVLALQLAAPMVLTMLIVDLSLGAASRVIPQMNVLALGLSLRVAVGLVAMVLLAAATASALGSCTTRWINALDLIWRSHG